jgi:NADP-reducing hydrogenase subunit HndB
MAAIHSLEDLERFKQQVIAERERLAQRGTIQIIVSMGSCGIAAGALDTYRAVQAQIEREQLDNVVISKTGCIGLCRYEPVIEVITGSEHKTIYGHVTPEIVERIVQEHIMDGRIVRDYQIIV